MSLVKRQGQRDGDPDAGEGSGTPDDEQITIPGSVDSLSGVQFPPTQVYDAVNFDVDTGTTLGEYVIEGKIAEGGMGTVFAAVHPMIGKRAAIKVLKAELCRDRIVAERFVDEARAVNQIGHPNIVDIFSFGEMPDGRRYFAMEWLKGETLRDRLRRGRMSLEEMAHVIRPLARALEAAHEKGIIHRDLKPENVFLVEVREEPLHVKLLDFGVAKLAHALVEAESLRDRREPGEVSGKPDRTYSGEILGTPMYIAPEQARDANDVGWASDIYSLGAIAFELVVGRPPFVAGTTVELVTMHLEQQPERPSSLIPEIPDEIDSLILAMLAKNPLDRPTLGHIRQTLERVRGPEPQRTTPTITTRSKKLVGPAEEITPTPDPSFVEVRFRSSTPGALKALDRDIGPRELPVAPARNNRLWFILAGVALGVLAVILLVVFLT